MKNNKKTLSSLLIFDLIFILLSIIFFVFTLFINNEKMQMSMLFASVTCMCIVLISNIVILPKKFLCKYSDNGVELLFGNVIYKTISYNEIKMIGIVKAVNGRHVEMTDKNKHIIPAIACYESDGFFQKTAVMTPSIRGMMHFDLCHSLYNSEDIMFLLANTKAHVVISYEIWKYHYQKLTADLIEYKERVFVEIITESDSHGKLIALECVPNDREV